MIENLIAPRTVFALNNGTTRLFLKYQMLMMLEVARLPFFQSLCAGSGYVQNEIGHRTLPHG
jgi:hypothetical protein